MQEAWIHGGAGAHVNMQPGTARLRTAACGEGWGGDLEDVFPTLNACVDQARSAVWRRAARVQDMRVGPERPVAGRAQSFGLLARACWAAAISLHPACVLTVLSELMPGLC